MNLEVQVVNAFIDGDSGGNPAGVVVDANSLGPTQKQAVARQVGLSETAFVSASRTATIKLEFFTPTRPIAHCGHATIAAFSLLRQLGIVGEGRLSKETLEGNRDILVDGDRAFMEQRAPSYRAVPPGSALEARALTSLGLENDQLLGEATPCVVNTGNSFLLIGVKDESTLKAIAPRLAEVEALSSELDLIGYYVFTRATKRPGRQAGARMFAPRFGIPEEAGTGMAAGPMACFLRDSMGVKEKTILIEQGWLMPTPSPSVIEVNLEIENDRIQRLMAGGKAKAVRSLRLEV